MSIWQTELKEYADKFQKAFSERSKRLEKDIKEDDDREKDIKSGKTKKLEKDIEKDKEKDEKELKESYATKAELSEYIKRDEVKNMFAEFTESITKSIKE
jgi:hypothetical protein